MITSIKVDIKPTEKQLKFIDGLVTGLKPAAAAIYAGYSIASGVHLIRKPVIQAIVRHCHENLAYVVARMDAVNAKGGGIAPSDE